MYGNHTESDPLSLWNYVRNNYQKIFENNPHISSAMWHLSTEIFDLATESLSKAWRLKKHRGWLQRRNRFKWEISKWEINIKDTLKNPCIWKLNVHF